MKSCDFGEKNKNKNKNKISTFLCQVPVGSVT
jgi:hypothetical protein